MVTRAPKNYFASIAEKDFQKGVVSLAKTLGYTRMEANMTDPTAPEQAAPLGDHNHEVCRESGEWLTDQETQWMIDWPDRGAAMSIFGDLIRARADLECEAVALAAASKEVAQARAERDVANKDVRQFLALRQGLLEQLPVTMASQPVEQWGAEIKREYEQRVRAGYLQGFAFHSQNHDGVSPTCPACRQFQQVLDRLPGGELVK